MSSAVCFNLDQSKILSPGNGLSYDPHMWYKDNLYLGHDVLKTHLVFFIII